MQPLRILLSAYQCGPGMGSVSQIGWEWYSRMSRYASVTLITHIRNRECLTAAGAPLPGTEVIYIDTEWFAGPLYRFASLLFPKSNHAVFLLSSADFYLYDGTALKQLKKRKEEWDLVHAITPVSPLAATRLYRLGLPLIVGPWNGGLGSPPGFPEIMKEDSAWMYHIRDLGKLIDRFFGSTKNAALILSASKATDQSLPAGARTLRMLENGVDLSRFLPAERAAESATSRPLEIVFVGRLVPFKGVGMLLQAVSEIRGDTPVRLKIIGDGPVRGDLEKTTADLDLGSIVTFTGNLPLDEVAAQMRMADVFCLPSVRESGGAVLLEAEASGLPVIGVNYGGPSELVDDEVGRLISAAGPEQLIKDLVDTFRDIASNPEQWRQRGERGYARAQKLYGWEARMRAMVEIYRRTLGHPEGGPAAESKLEPEEVKTQEDHSATVRESLSRNVSVDIVARAGYLVSRFFIPPFVLAHVSLEAYGLWSTAFILVSYVGLSTMGISSVYIKFVAEYTARRQYDKANQLLSTGLCLTVPFCLIVFIAVYLLWPDLSVWLHVDPSLREDAREVVLSVVAIFLASLSLGAFHDAVVGAQKTDMVQKRWVVCYLIETALIFILVGMGRGIKGLAEAFLVRTVVDLSLCLIMAVRLLPWLRISPRLITREAFHTLFSFGGVVQIQGFLSVGLGSIERAIAAPLVGLAGTGLLDIGKKLPSMAGSIPIAFASSFTPAASYLHGGLQGSPAQAETVRKLYLRGARYMNLASAYFSGFLVAAPAPILGVWVGQQYPGAAYLVVIFSIASQVHLLTGPGTSILKGIGRPKEEFYYAIPNVIALLIAVPLSRVILGQWTGLGIATAVAISTVVAAAYFLWHAHRLLAISFTEYWKTVLFPGLVPYIVAAPFGFPAAYAASHTSRWVAAGWIGAIGCLYSLLLLFIVDRFVWSAHERQWFHSLIAKKLGRRSTPEIPLAESSVV